MMTAGLYVLLSLATFLTQLCVAHDNETCPTVSILSTPLGYRLIIDNCSQVPLILERYQDYNITEVVITNAMLDKLPQLLCDHTEIQNLNFSHNLLTDFPSCLYTMTELRVLDLSYNRITSVHGEDIQDLKLLDTVYLQRNRIHTVNYEAWSALNSTQVKILTLNNNELKALPPDIIRLSFTSLEQLDLSGNNFACSCLDKWMEPWLESMQDVLVNKYEIMCSNSATGGPFPVLKIKYIDKKFLCEEKTTTKYSEELTEIIIAFLVVIIVLPFIVGAIFYTIWRKRLWIFYKTRWHPFDVDDCMSEEKQYDVFISCAHEDEDWCTEKVINFLEDKNYKVCWHKEHFRPGEPVMNSVGRCIEQSKRTLCILTNYFTNSPMCMRELEMALAIDFEKNKHRTVIIKSRDVCTSQFEPHVQRFLRTTTYIERGSVRFYDNLMYALPIKTLDGLLREFDIVVREDIPLEECTAY